MAGRGRRDSTVVGSDDGILTFATDRGQMGVNHDFSCGTTAGIHCRIRSGVQETVLGTSSVRQVAKADIPGGGTVLSFERTMRRVRVDIRRRNDAVTGERSDNRGGRGQGIAVEVVCKR